MTPWGGRLRGCLLRHGAFDDRAGTESELFGKYRPNLITRPLRHELASINPATPTLTRLRAHNAELRSLGVRALSIFGSTARGEARPDSDVDVLVEFEGPATLEAYLALKERLEQVLQTRVDLVTSKGIKGRLKSIIDDEAVLVA